MGREQEVVDLINSEEKSFPRLTMGEGITIVLSMKGLLIITVTAALVAAGLYILGQYNQEQTAIRQEKEQQIEQQIIATKQEAKKKFYRSRKGSSSKDILLMDLLLCKSGDEGSMERFLDRWGEDSVSRLLAANDEDRSYMLGMRLAEVLGDGDSDVGFQIYKNTHNLWGKGIISPEQVWKDFGERYAAAIIETEKRMMEQDAEGWNNGGAEIFAKAFFKILHPVLPNTHKLEDSDPIRKLTDPLNIETWQPSKGVN